MRTNYSCSAHARSVVAVNDRSDADQLPSLLTPRTDRFPVGCSTLLLDGPYIARAPLIGTRMSCTTRLSPTYASRRMQNNWAYPAFARPHFGSVFVLSGGRSSAASHPPNGAVDQDEAPAGHQHPQPRADPQADTLPVLTLGGGKDSPADPGDRQQHRQDDQRIERRSSGAHGKGSRLSGAVGEFKKPRRHGSRKGFSFGDGHPWQGNLSASVTAAGRSRHVDRSR